MSEKKAPATKAAARKAAAKKAAATKAAAAKAAAAKAAATKAAAVKAAAAKAAAVKAAVAKAAATKVAAAKAAATKASATNVAAIKVAVTKAATKAPTTATAKSPLVSDDRQSQLKLLIARGKEQGYLTYGEVNDHLPPDIVDPEQIEDIVNTINDMGITVYEKAPDAEALLLSDSPVQDEEAVEEATAALAVADAEFGRTTDPVRMYMREMGTVELLTREGEIRIAKRIEEGLEQVKRALSMYPPTCSLLLHAYDPVKEGEGRLTDLITGFIDPNAPDEIAQPTNPKAAALAKKEKEDSDEDEDEDEEEEEEEEDDGEGGGSLF